MLDNSVALAWCFEDEQTPEVMALLDRTVETGATAPMLWPLEALNGLFAAERRRRLDAARGWRRSSANCRSGWTRRWPITRGRPPPDWRTDTG